MTSFSFIVKKRDSKSAARTGMITTPHGTIKTPAFVPVGTQGTVKSLTPEELNTIGVQLFFVNTYHMYLRPGIEVVKKFGGLHNFMHWNKPLMTDSGGFQVFSLGRSDLVKISDDGVQFRSHWDGSKHIFTPETSMQWQWGLGADMHIAFDDCTPYPATHEKAKISMERTHAWATRSIVANAKCQMLNAKLKNPYQALYGSVQGSVYKDLRQESATFISGMDFDGIAIGGMAVGESKQEMQDVLDWVTPLLPEHKPRHALGVGEIDDIFMMIERGVDTFDVVQPTRLARVGILYTGKTQLDITKSKFSEDTKPIEEGCQCYTCQNFSRGYIHHLFHVKELLGYRLATIHNLFFIHKLVLEIREAIEENRLIELKKKWL